MFHVQEFHILEQLPRPILNLSLLHRGSPFFLSKHTLLAQSFLAVFICETQAEPARVGMMVIDGAKTHTTRDFWG